MKVTFTETIEHSADITADMVRAYLAQSGATIVRTQRGGWAGWSYGDADNYVMIDDGEFPHRHRAKCVVERIAVLERRDPCDVLADIAKVGRC